MNRPVYLITGPAGAGKTTLSNYLTEQGHVCVETDSTPGLSYYVNKNNKPVPYPQGADAAWWAAHNYVWELDRLAKYINELEPADAPVFVCGNAGNIKKAWDMFKAVFYLDIPSDIMLARVTSGNKGENFAKRVEEPDQLIRWSEPFKKEMLELGAVSVDATQPIEKVAATILAQVKANAAA